MLLGIGTEKTEFWEPCLSKGMLSLPRIRHYGLSTYTFLKASSALKEFWEIFFVDELMNALNENAQDHSQLYFYLRQPIFRSFVLLRVLPDSWIRDVVTFDKHLIKCTHNQSAILRLNAKFTASGVLQCDKRLINFDIKWKTLIFLPAQGHVPDDLLFTKTDRLVDGEFHPKQRVSPRNEWRCLPEAHERSQAGMRAWIVPTCR